MSDEIWILGATGRAGRPLAATLSRSTELPLVLVGRDEGRLASIDTARPVRTVVLDGLPATAAAIREQRPRVVVNLTGDYAATAVEIARAVQPGGHYVDLANDLSAVPGLLGLHDEAVAAGSTVVTGAGFGVLATESLVVELCRDRPAPSFVQVDALAAVGMEDGVMGEAFAASIVGVLATGGREFRDGRLVRTRLARIGREFPLPDGTSAPAASVPSGELVAAQAASGAPNVVATSALAPTGRVVRALLPAVGAVAAVPAVTRFATRRLARIRTKATPPPRPASWGHAVIVWPDGARREAWLRTEDAMAYTAAVLAVVTRRLAAGESTAGAYTPARAFGAQIAVEAGASIDVQADTPTQA